MTGPVEIAGFPPLDETPVRPADAQVERLKALAGWHAEWVEANADKAGFHPEQHPKAGSDYNLHEVLLDAPDGASEVFYMRADQIMGVGGSDVQAAAGDGDAQRIQDQWDAAKARLLKRWPKLAGPMVAELASQAETVVEAGDLARLGELQVSAGVIAAVAVPLRKSGTELAAEAAAGVVEEAAAQSVTVTAPDAPARERVVQHADAVARIIANGYASGAARTALQLSGAGPAEVRAEVERHLTELGESVNGLVGENIGALLSAAQFAGRLAVLEEHPAQSYRSVEINDRARCRPCADTSGTVYPTLKAALADYPGGGSMKRCEGRSRCRGYPRPQW